MQLYKFTLIVHKYLSSHDLSWRSHNFELWKIFYCIVKVVMICKLSRPYKYGLFTSKSRISEIDLRLARQITQGIAWCQKSWSLNQKELETILCFPGRRTLNILVDRPGGRQMDYSPRNALLGRHGQLLPCIG